MKKIFESMDEDGSGTVEVAELKEYITETAVRGAALSLFSGPPNKHLVYFGSGSRVAGASRRSQDLGIIGPDPGLRELCSETETTTTKDTHSRHSGQRAPCLLRMWRGPVG